MIRVNLLGVKERKQLKAIHAEVIVFVLAIGLIVAGYIVINSNMNHKIMSLNSDVKRLQTELKSLQKVKKQVDAFKKKKNELQRKIDIVKNLKKGQKGYYKLLTTLEYALPEDIWIKNMKYSNNKITMSGAALRTSSVNEFIVNLYNSGMFTGIELKVVKKQTVENIDINDFSISANVVLGG